MDDQLAQLKFGSLPLAFGTSAFLCTSRPRFLLGHVVGHQAIGARQLAPGRALLALCMFSDQLPVNFAVAIAASRFCGSRITVEAEKLNSWIAKHN
jgi:hypothetical protein